MSKAGHQVFYCVLRKLYPDQSNKVLYHVITLMKKFTDKSFELLIDLTMSTPSNEPEVGNNKDSKWMCVNGGFLVWC